MTSSRSALRHASLGVATLSSAVLVACGGGGGGNAPEGVGTLRVALTDAPCHTEYDHVFVTIERVRVHRSAAAGDNDAGWSEIVLATPLRVDLMTLTNGVLQELGQAQLPAGDYQQVRLVLADNAGQPFAHAVKPVGRNEVALDTPSGQQSGLKINMHTTVAADQVADLVIDFDVCRSVVTRGSSGRFNLKPVLTATTVLSDAGQRVVGYVSPSLANDGTVVSVQSAGQPVKATPPDATGRFVLYPVPAGTYDLVLTSAGRVTAVMTGVPVVTTAYTNVNTSATPIDLPVSTLQRTLSGVARINGSNEVPAALARVQQTLAASAPSVTVEVAARPVDAQTGGYSFTLPADAPLRTAYAASAPAYNWTADTAAAGKYTLIGSADGRTTQTHAVDLFGADVTRDIVFP